VSGVESLRTAAETACAMLSRGSRPDVVIGFLRDAVEQSTVEGEPAPDDREKALRVWLDAVKVEGATLRGAFEAGWLAALAAKVGANRGFWRSLVAGKDDDAYMAGVEELLAVEGVERISGGAGRGVHHMRLNDIDTFGKHEVRVVALVLAALNYGRREAT